LSISNKLNTIKQLIAPLFTSTKSTVVSITENTGKAAVASKDLLTIFIERYKGIRRIILAIVLWINIHIFLVTTNMYIKYGTVDVQWIIYAGYWTAILGTFIGFYTMSRIKEFTTDTDLAPKGQWLANTPSETKALEEKRRQDAIDIAEASMQEERIEIDGDAILEKEGE